LPCSSAEEAFGQQVLHQHLIDGVAAEVRVEGGLAHGEEVVKSGLERRVFLVRQLDLGVETPGQLGDAPLELPDGLLEAFDVRLGVVVEVVEGVGDLPGVGQLEAVAFAAVLNEHGPAGVLEDDVAARIALLELLADLGVCPSHGVSAATARGLQRTLGAFTPTDASQDTPIARLASSAVGGVCRAGRSGFDSFPRSQTPVWDRAPVV